MTTLTTPLPTPTTDDDTPQNCGETYIRLMRAIAQDDALHDDTMSDAHLSELDRIFTRAERYTTDELHKFLIGIHDELMTLTNELIVHPARRPPPVD